MTTIAIITALFCLVFPVAALLIILADKAREVAHRAALNYVEVWGKYHDKRQDLEAKEQPRP